MRRKILMCLENVGCLVEESTDDLLEVIEDSLIYISFIVELEQMFGIEIPDDLLLQEELLSVSGICHMLEKMI